MERIGDLMRIAAITKRPATPRQKRLDCLPLPLCRFRRLPMKIFLQPLGRFFQLNLIE